MQDEREELIRCLLKNVDVHKGTLFAQNVAFEKGRIKELEMCIRDRYTFHQILTLASMVEKEANSESDRKTVAQVFWTRLHENWSLGSDVTTYYGAHKEIGVDELTWNEPVSYTHLE